MPPLVSDEGPGVQQSSLTKVTQLAGGTAGDLVAQIGTLSLDTPSHPKTLTPPRPQPRSSQAGGPRSQRWGEACA